jgi:hypothetical protein
VFNISKCLTECLSDIAAIIDMDGFSVNGKFLCKELGFLKVGDATAQSFFFDISLRWRDLTPKDLRACKYVQTHIHKLPFGVPAGIDAIPLSALKETVRKPSTITRARTHSLRTRAGITKKPVGRPQHSIRKPRMLRLSKSAKTV